MDIQDNLYECIPQNEEKMFFKLSNPILFTYLDRLNQEHSNLNYICNTCIKIPVRCSYSVPYEPDYLKTILNTNYAKVQMLSIIDVSINIKNTYHSIAYGTLDSRSLLDSPLISWDTTHLTCANADTLTKELKQIIIYNRTHNRIIQKYLMLYEWPHPKLGISILGSSAINEILEKSSHKLEFEDMENAYNIQQLYLLEHINSLPIKSQFSKKGTYDIGTQILRETETFKPCKLQTNIQGFSYENDITIEAALFLFYIHME